MKKGWLVFSLMASMLSSAYGAEKFSADLAIDMLDFQKPPQGVGKAGTLITKTANVTNNGIVLNISNVNNMFDSQIFMRPTFLGFTTQFGNYGFELEADSLFHSIYKTQLQNSKFVLDENQLNLSGEFFSYFNKDSVLKLKNFRLYCQSLAQFEKIVMEDTAGDMIKNCYSFLTLNGSYAPGNEAAAIEYEGLDIKSGDKMYINSMVRSFDLRKKEMNADILSIKTVSNGSYFINAGAVNINCDKDEDLTELDTEKIKKACFNRLKISPVSASIADHATKSTFKLDVQDVTVKDKILYLSLNQAFLSDPASTTTINNLLLNCKKEKETDLFELTQLLEDCIAHTRLSIAEVKSTKPDEKDSSVKNIGINISNGSLVSSAQVKFLGIKARVNIYGTVALNAAKRQLYITVTDTRLPLGINSVKLLMYFLKKNFISKEVSIHKNVITVSI